MLPPDEKRDTEQERDETVLAQEVGRGRRRGGGKQAAGRRHAGQNESGKPNAKRDRTQRPGQREEQPEQGRDALAALELEPDGIKVPDEGAEGGEHVGAFGEPGAGDEDGRDRFERIEKEDDGTRLLARSAHRVGRPDIARAGGADIALAHRLHEDQPERDRAEEIADRKRQPLEVVQHRE